MRRLAAAIVTALALAPFAFAQDAKQAEAIKEAIRKDRAEATKLLGQLALAKGDACAAIESKLDLLDFGARLQATCDGLRSSTAGVRKVSAKELRAFGIKEVTPALVNLATKDKDKDVRREAHEAAVALDPETARKWYTFVAARDMADRKLLALQGLEAMGPAAAGSLQEVCVIYESARLDIRAQLVKLNGFDTVKMNLGTSGKAAVNAPIDLPNVSVFEANTTVQSVPTARIDAWEKGALAALRAMAGQDLGASADAYRAYYKDHVACAAAAKDTPKQ